MQFLQEIANEQQFDVTFVDIEETSISGKSQCLVQLSTLPVAVCYGSGTTSTEAQSAAAQNALEYLKIMTKKWENEWGVSVIVLTIENNLFIILEKLTTNALIILEKKILDVFVAGK